MAAYEIPSVVAEHFTDDERRNIHDRNGWAVGTVKRVSDGIPAEMLTPVFIELFNGNGGYGEFGGVRFNAEDNGTFREAYAYATRSAVPDRKENYWYISEYLDPENPDYGTPAP